MTFKKLLRRNIMPVGGLSVALVLVAGVVYLVTTYRAFKLPAIDTAAVVTSSGSALDFTAIGVKLPLASAVSNAVYAPYYSPSTDGAKVYGISTQDLEKDGDSTSACTASHGPLGIIRATTTAPMQLVPPNGEASMAPDNKTLFKIGAMYYQYVAPQEFGCSEGGKVTETNMLASQNAVAQSFVSLQSTSVSTTSTTTN